MNTSRFVYVWVALIALSAVAGAFYLDNLLGTPLCILCKIERIIFGLIGVVALAALLHRSQLLMQKIYAWSALFLSLAGLATAARQVWLQQQPMSVVHNCLPRFSYLVENMPANKALDLLKGTTNCSDFTWTYQGLSLAGWAAVAFGLVVLLMLAQSLALRCAGRVCGLQGKD